MKSKEFNVTGLCVPSKHYMVDISGKLAKIMEMVDSRLPCFTVYSWRRSRMHWNSRVS